MNQILKILPRLSTAVLLLFFGILIGRCFTPLPKNSHSTLTAQSVVAAPTTWTCSMHPSVQAPSFGDCPICGMDLIPLETGGNLADGNTHSLLLEPGQKSLAGIRTSRARRAKASHEVRLVGKLAVDETQIATLSAYVSGRLDRLYVDYTGLKVRAGDHMAEIYSPQLFHAQKELIVAVESAKRFGASSDEALVKISHSTVVAGRKKLALYGLTEKQMQEIIDLGEPSEQITLTAPMGGTVIHRNAVEGQYVDEGDPLYTIANLDQLWLELDVYESDLPWIRFGQQVHFTVDAWPGETFSGSISFLDPVLDPMTRTVHVRVEVDNRDGRLRPEMFVRATVNTPIVGSGGAAPVDMQGKWMCPMHPEVIAEQPEDCRICGMDLETAESLGFVTEAIESTLPLLIPVTAPLLTGDRAVVFVELPGTQQHGASTFEARDISLGPRAGMYFVVKDGLVEGESVVSRGAFAIDSELQLRGKQSMMAPDGDGAQVGHQHEGMPQMDMEKASDSFRRLQGQMLLQLVALGEALASDDFLAAQKVAQSVAGRADALSQELAPESATPHLQMLKKASVTVAMASNLDKMRIAFEKLQQPAAHLAQSFGYLGVKRELAIFHCPMALEDGADWIDFHDDGVRNPYYGASMLKCGNETRTIPGFEQQ